MTVTWMRRAAGGLAAAVVTVGVAVAAAGPSAAGGGEWMYPVSDRYEPGQDVVMVGYTTTAQPRPATGGRYDAWLRVDPAAEGRAGDRDPYVDPTDVRLAPVVVGRPVDAAWGRRASISFTLPADLPPGRYQLVLCNDPCTEAPGLLTPENLNVGVPPDYPIVRNWPPSEPAIRWLADDALLFSPLFQPVTAADFRAGRYATPAGPPTTAAPAPGPDASTTTVADASPSRVAGEARSPADGEAPATTARSAPVESEPAATRGTNDRNDRVWQPLGAWLAGLAALALACAALLARRRPGVRPAPPPGPRGEVEPEATLVAPPATHPTDGDEAHGADDPTLART